MTDPDAPEAKIVYSDGERVRVLRGQVRDYSKDFIEIVRRDGRRLIRSELVLRIEYLKNGSEVDTARAVEPRASEPESPVRRLGGEKASERVLDIEWPRL